MAREPDYSPDEHRKPANRWSLPTHHQDQESLERGGQGSSPPSPQIPSPNTPQLRPERQAYRVIDRDRPLQLRDSEIRTLADIGTFRSVTLPDLARYRYGGDRRQALAEIRNLTRQGLVQVRTARPEATVYLALSREGQKFLSRHRPREIPSNQVFYSRFVKPREAKHDAALYRLYQDAARRIAHDGGRVRRVVLDFELKKSVYRRLARLSDLPESEQAGRRREIAEEHGLTVVNGKIPLPDVRIEYETRDREQTKVDLELATSDYHHSSLAEKSQAGFTIFALQEDAAPLRRAIGDPELTKDIFSI